MSLLFALFAPVKDINNKRHDPSIRSHVQIHFGMMPYLSNKNDSKHSGTDIKHLLYAPTSPWRQQRKREPALHARDVVVSPEDTFVL